jgi:predicted metalloprotease with PDZ domain
MKDYRYEYSVKKPEGQFGSTSLEKSEYSQEGVDVFLAKDYFELHDCPVLYAKPDTASVNVVGTVISIGVHSPEGNLKADEIMEGIEPVFHAAAEYLGGDLPAEKYTVLVYGMDLKQSMMGVGALEHHTSTVVNVPDISDQYLKMMADESMSQLLRDIVSHEFFHIVTPLNIHSEHIADYDFMNPQMSKHLWLYEGVTEYNANISQARAGILTEEQFMDNMFEKMSGDRSFNQHIPFTVSSEFALSYFEDQYLNVYEKGALIGMCLDLQLRIDSEGAYGLPNLLMELSTVYGKDTFFVDDELFDIIEKQTENENVREFFARYVEGAEPLPYRELLDHVGYLYQAEKTTRSVSDGGIVLGLKGDLVAVSGNRRNDAFVRSLGLNRRDVIVSWNGVKMNADNYQQVFDTFIQEAKIGDPVEVVVKRKSGEKEKKMKLNGNVQYHDEKELDVLEKKESPSPEEQAMKKAWMSN